MSRADELLAMAGSDPKRTFQDADAYLVDLEDPMHYERAVTLRALSLAARHTGQIADSIAYARRSSAAAKEGGLLRVELLAVLTETGSLAMSGDLEGSLQIIESILAEVDDEEMRAEFGYQRAAVLGNMGRLVEAIESFEDVLPAYERLGDPQPVMMALNQLGRLHTAVGNLTQAAAFLERALSMARDNDELASLPGIMHNLGLLASYRGDIPEALNWLERSDDLYMEVSGSDAPQHVARAEVLISAGRFEEAYTSARVIAESTAARHDIEHESNALLVAARAALMAGRSQQASQLAEAAANRFADSAATTREAEAKAIDVEARFIGGEATPTLLSEAEVVVERLADEGMLVAASQARFVAARIASIVGEGGRARSHLRRIAIAKSGPVEVRLQSAVARARLSEMDGESGAAARTAASGLRLIDDYQATLAATELRMGIEKHGAELAEIGLRHALEARQPRRVLSWLDRTRARALRVRPVTSPTSDDVSESLADLRRVVAELRKPQSRDDPELMRRRGQLEKTIARAERVRRRVGKGPGDLSVGELIDRLDGTALLEMGVVHGRLLAVLVRNGRSRVIELEDMDGLSGELSHLRFAMRRAARRGRTFDSSAFEPISRALFGGVSLGDGPVLVIPPPSLMSVPWAALPALRARELVVAPSAQVWWRARGVGSELSGIGVVVAGGPDLEVAEREVRRIGQVQRGATVLPPGVGVEVVKEEIEGAAVAHIACHATFSVENPMFSSLRLGDGDLNVYDIERLQAPPSLVVLSACDSGYTEARAGDELAGLTSALLSMGTRSVIASVGLVPDSPATSDLMVDLHKGLVAGLEPAKALAAAQEKAFDDPERFVSAASFICVGA